MSSSCKLRSSASLFLAILATPATAEPPERDEIIVSATRTPERASRLGSAVTVLDAASIAARQTGDLGVLLREVPGLAVSRTGPVGGVTQVRIRGAEANHTLTLIDGIEVADLTGSGEFDFAHGLAFDLDRIELVRGAQSALYGSDALGGVVSILTRAPEPGFSVFGLAEAGSFDSYRVGAGVNAGGSRGGIRANAHILETDGTSAAAGGEENDGVESLHLRMKGLYAPVEWLTLDGAVHYADLDIDTDAQPFGTVIDSDDVTLTEQIFARGGVRLALSERSFVRADFSYAETERDILYRDFFVLGMPRESSHLEGTRTKTLLEAGHGFATGPLGHDLVLAAEHEVVSFDSANTGGLSFADQDRSTDTVSFAGEYRISIGAHTHLSAGGRFDDNEAFKDAATWRLAAAQEVEAIDGRLHASLGTGIKEPSFTELYGFFPGSFIGNAELEPEKSQSWDVGWQQRLFGDRAVFDVTYFAADLEDEITAVFVGFNSTVINQDGASERKGIELTARAQLLDTLTIDASYTWLDAENPDGTAEVRRTENIGNAALDWAFCDGRGHANLSLRYNGQQEDDDFSAFPSRRVSLDDFVLGALALSFDMTERVALTVRAEDLLDEAPTEVFGYGSPGFAAYAGLRVRIGGER